MVGVTNCVQISVVSVKNMEHRRFIAATKGKLFICNIHSLLLKILKYSNIAIRGLVQASLSYFLL